MQYFDEPVFTTTYLQLRDSAGLSGIALLYAIIFIQHYPALLHALMAATAG